jgi:hypothetical protein
MNWLNMLETGGGRREGERRKFVGKLMKYLVS